MTKLTSAVSICLCLLGTIDAKASTNDTNYLTPTHIVVIKEHKSYRLDYTYGESSVLFINHSDTDLSIRMNECMFYIIVPKSSAMFWRNGKLWIKGYST